MATSSEIKDLVTALSAAQREMKSAEKNARNKHYGSDYANLDSAWDAIREPLTKNGLSVIQTTSHDADTGTLLLTTLAHTSGQWIRGSYPLEPVQRTPQALGSAVTYARRYALMAIVGIAPGMEEDDDGEMAERISHETGQSPIQKKPSLGWKPPSASEAVNDSIVDSLSASTEDVQRFMSLASKNGWSIEDIKFLISKRKNIPIDKVTSAAVTNEDITVMGAIVKSKTPKQVRETYEHLEKEKK